VPQRSRPPFGGHRVAMELAAFADLLAHQCGIVSRQQLLEGGVADIDIRPTPGVRRPGAPSVRPRRPRPVEPGAATPAYRGRGAGCVRGLRRPRASARPDPRPLPSQAHHSRTTVLRARPTATKPAPGLVARGAAGRSGRHPLGAGEQLPAPRGATTRTAPFGATGSRPHRGRHRLPGRHLRGSSPGRRARRAQRPRAGARPLGRPGPRPPCRHRWRHDAATRLAPLREQSLSDGGAPRPRPAVPRLDRPRMCVRTRLSRRSVTLLRSGRLATNLQQRHRPRAAIAQAARVATRSAKPTSASLTGPSGTTSSMATPLRASSST
jgi:hypothetical protein